MSTSLTFLLGGQTAINRLGYGAMRLTGQPGNFGPYPDWAAGKALLRRAVELGVNFIDTAEAYGPGHNEELLADALYPYPTDLVIATKGGILKTSPRDIRPNGHPDALRRSAEASLRRLKLETLALYQLHRPDPAVPFADSVGALAGLQQAGKVRHVGLSNVSLVQLQQAEAIVPVASVQNRYNVLEDDDQALLEYCAGRGIAFSAWGPLGANPMQPGSRLESGELAGQATRAGLTPEQTALRWLLTSAPNTVAIPGTTSRDHLEQNMAVQYALPAAGATP